MKQWLTMSLAIALAMLAAAADKQEFTTHALPVADHGTLEIKAPQGWGLEKKGAINPTGPRTVELVSEAGDVTVQITMFWDGFGPKQLKPTEKDLEEMVTKSAEAQFVASSVEKKTTIEKLKGEKVSGSFARFTDAQWVGKKVPRGQFSHVASGAMRCGDLWGVFTVLSNDKDGPLFKKGMAVIESLRKANP